MEMRLFRCTAVGALAALGAWTAAATWVMAGEAAGPQAAGPEPQAVSLSLDQFVLIVLGNHPDLEAASPASAPDAQARPGQAGMLVVRPAPTTGRTTQAELRDLVSGVLFQAIQAYWEQVRCLGEVEVGKPPVTRAEAMAQRLQPGTEAEAADLLPGTAETCLAEMRIALHRARQQADAGEDRLKLLMNDEMLPVASDMRLFLTTEAPDPPAADSLDLLNGLDTAVLNRLGSRGDSLDKADRRRHEALAMEVKAAYRRAAAARAMFLLARSRVTAAGKALDAADDAWASRGRLTGQLLLLWVRAHEALPDAQRQLLAARVDYQIALAAWDRATGQLLERWNIDVQPSR